VPGYGTSGLCAPVNLDDGNSWPERTLRNNVDDKRRRQMASPSSPIPPAERYTARAAMQACIAAGVSTAAQKRGSLPGEAGAQRMRYCATQKARRGINLIRTCCPGWDICRRNLTSASSSHGAEILLTLPSSGGPKHRHELQGRARNLAIVRKSTIRSRHDRQR
jgi:hypothetical protein